jgi:hypothetical protein
MRNVSVSDINDPAKAKLMAQIDLEDDVTTTGKLSHLIITLNAFMSLHSENR